MFDKLVAIKEFITNKKFFILNESDILIFLQYLLFQIFYKVHIQLGRQQ